MKRLYKSETDKKLFGVCGGLAEYFGLDSTIVRVGVVFLSFATFSAVFWAYIVCAFVMPDKGKLPPDVQGNVYDAKNDGNS